LIKCFKPKERIPASWRTVIRNVRDKRIKNYKHIEKKVPWPVHWKMDELPKKKD
jgi:hypothetical protein